MSAPNNDRKIVLWLGASVLVLIIVVSVLIPAHTEEDRRPVVGNNGSEGAKAAFLLLPKLGYKVQRWDLPETQLDKLDAAKTTLIMADMYVARKQQKDLTAAVQRFLDRGGRVLDTGALTLLPEGMTGQATNASPALCYTIPEGQGALARAGQLSMQAFGAWDEKGSKLGAALHVEQRCGADAVVVRYRVGRGEAIWWASATPLTNRGLHEDNNLRLLLATVGEPGRTVVFDEMSHADTGDASPTRGLPLGWLMVQLALIAFVLILSFSRRRGPMRLPVRVPRSSPVEFAESMGNLYQSAGRTDAATSMGRRRLLRFLETECGVPRQAIAEGPEAIEAALSDRMGGDWSRLAQHLREATQAEQGEATGKSALRLVQALDDDMERLEAVVAPKRLAAAKARQAEELEESTEETSLLAGLGKEK